MSCRGPVNKVLLFSRGSFLKLHPTFVLYRKITLIKPSNSNIIIKALDMSSEVRAPTGTKRKTRRLSFADEQPGRQISEVEYCDNLHYSDPAQQVQYDESGNPASPKASASCCVIS